MKQIKKILTGFLMMTMLVVLFQGCSAGSYSQAMTFEDAGLKCQNATIVLENCSDYEAVVSVEGISYAVQPGKKLKKRIPASASSSDKKLVCVNSNCEKLVLLPCYQYDFTAETW